MVRGTAQPFFVDSRGSLARFCPPKSCTHARRTIRGAWAAGFTRGAWEQRLFVLFYHNFLPQIAVATSAVLFHYVFFFFLEEVKKAFGLFERRAGLRPCGLFCCARSARPLLPKISAKDSIWFLLVKKKRENILLFSGFYFLFLNLRATRFILNSPSRVHGYASISSMLSTSQLCFISV